MNENINRQAARVIEKFGGAYPLARDLTASTGKQVAAATIYRWTYPKSRGGTGGHIPPRWIGPIRDLAMLFDIPLSETDLRYD